MPKKPTDMTGEELLAAYNDAAKELGQKLVKRFSDRKTAIRRVEEVLGDLKQIANKGGKSKDKEPRASRMTFDLPASRTVKNFRDGTKRKAIFDALQKGATFDEVIEVVKDFDKKNPPKKARTEKSLRAFVYEAIRLLHFFSGYGLREEGGKIFVFGGK